MTTDENVKVVFKLAYLQGFPVIQMFVDDEIPDDEELDLYIDELNELLQRNKGLFARRKEI